MNRWQGKVAVVTGASAGIGLATAKALLREGLIVVGFARRKEKMENEVKNETNKSNFYAREVDVADDKSIAENFQWVQKTFGKLNFLINNAGIAITTSIEESSTAELDKVFKVNVFGPLHCTKEAIPLMKGTNSEAHIVNVNSILGRKILDMDGLYNVYPASKFALRALSETLAIELKSSKIRVSSVSPGLVKTEITKSIWETNTKLPVLQAEDVARAILYILGEPSNVEIVDIIIQPKAV